jgi:ABC-type uncharacterized transport system fused permease/ATPase subunit
MNSSELILIIVVIVIIVGLQVGLKRIKKPLQHYLKIIAAIGLLMLIWIFGEKNHIPMRIILSVITLASLYKEFLSMRTKHPNS